MMNHPPRAITCHLDRNPDGPSAYAENQHAYSLKMCHVPLLFGRHAHKRTVPNDDAVRLAELRDMTLPNMERPVSRTNGATIVTRHRTETVFFNMSPQLQTLRANGHLPPCSTPMMNTANMKSDAVLQHNVSTRQPICVCNYEANPRYCTFANSWSTPCREHSTCLYLCTVLLLRLVHET